MKTLTAKVECSLSHFERELERDEYQRTSGILSSGGEVVALYQGTTSQLAEKLIRAVGRDFSPGIKQVKSTVALATEVCFRMFCLKTGFFQQAVQSCRKRAKSRRFSAPAGFLPHPRHRLRRKPWFA